MRKQGFLHTSRENTEPRAVSPKCSACVSTCTCPGLPAKPAPRCTEDSLGVSAVGGGDASAFAKGSRAVRLLVRSSFSPQPPLRQHVYTPAPHTVTLIQATQKGQLDRERHEN